ncbi:hypothetical protein FQR65_LT03890 [Abscondita terminalis]|nr:hypothetical protein FQR65_LT03890 [Abscondita terminalis]
MIERKWRQLRYKDDDSDNDSCNVTTTKPLLSSAERDSTRSSESSDSSEISTGKIYLALDLNHIGEDGDNDGENNAMEDQLLLSWPNHKRFLSSQCDVLDVILPYLRLRQILVIT